MKVGDLGKNRRLILSTEKYEHHTPWPAFKNPIHPDSLAKVVVNILQKKEDIFAFLFKKHIFLSIILLYNQKQNIHP